MESPVNLWKRAELERPSPETRQLIEDDAQPEYDAVLEEVAAAGVALNALLGLIPAAQERMAQARQSQHDYFASRRTGGVI